MGLLDWLNSFLGKKEENDIKLEPDGVKEFENNEDIQTDIKETVEEPKEEIVIEEVKAAKPVRSSKAKTRSRTRKKGRR